MAPASSFIKVQAGQKQSGSRWRNVYARKRRAQERIKKKRRSTEWQAQPNPIHMAIAHHIHFPQAEATINVLSPRPRGTIRVLSIVPPLWLAPAAKGGGASPGRANGTRRRRAAPGSTLNIHRGRRGRVGGQGAPSSTSALPPRRHGPIKRQPPPNRPICGVVGGDTPTAASSSVSLQQEGEEGEGGEEGEEAARARY